MKVAHAPLHALRYLRRRLVRNHLHAAATKSRFRLATILFCSGVFWLALFVLFFQGFQFLSEFVKLSAEVIDYLFALFFLSLLVMLVFSTGIIMHTSLFSSREAAFLLTTPASADRVFSYKFGEAMAFSSWGFLLLCSPMMVAYGLTVSAGWPFYVLFLVYLGFFVLIPGSLGGIGAILVAHFLPRRRRTVLILMLVVALTLIGWMMLRLLRTPGDMLSRDWLDSLLSRLAFSQNPLLPSRWLARGMLGTARGEWRDGLFYLGVTASNAGVCYLLAAVVARDLYRPAYSRVQGNRSSRRRIGGHAFDKAFHRVFFFLRRPVRLLILKDLRSFVRDPAQWSQFLIFFGLLTLYFASIRRLGYHVQNAYFRYLLSFLNLAVTALILSTFTSRFIFPMLSLEGRNFWVLGLLPLRRSEILWGKFAFASGISLVATEILILLSDTMLKVGPAMTAIHVVIVAILCFGLSGISVGLGARMPNLREDDPSKIAAGFGGTLNLLVSLLYITLVIGCLALPVQLYVAGYEVNEVGQILAHRTQFMRAMFAAVVVSGCLGMLVTTWSLRLGIRAFNRMEL